MMKEKDVQEFAADIALLMLSAALIHNHIKGELPYQSKDALNVFMQTGQFLKEKRGLKKNPTPYETGNYIAERLVNHLATKRCKGLSIPAPAFFSWFSFLPCNGTPELPAKGEIPLEMNDGDQFNLYFDINKEGEGSVYRYHDPDGDTPQIGRESYMRISGKMMSNLTQRKSQ